MTHWSSVALRLLAERRAEEAERCCRVVLGLQPNDHLAFGIRARALLTMGRVEEGFASWEAQRLCGPPTQRYWSGQPLNGETVLVTNRLSKEFGYGDAIQFARFAPQVTAAGGRAVLLVPARLQRLLTTLEGVARVMTFEDACTYDYHTAGFGLPHVFRTTMTTIPAVPYLQGDASQWSDFISSLPGLKVGLCWASGKAGEPGDNRRSMHLTDMALLLDVPGCSFVSLQTGPLASQGQEHMHQVALGDFQRTADLIAGLDLVVTVDTAVAHLAGALGKQVWTLLPFAACWRWFQGRDDSPWYPTMRLFRQETPGDWAGVVERVRRDLRPDVTRA